MGGTHQAKRESMRDDDHVKVFPSDALVREVTEHGRDERRRPVVDVEPGFPLREPVRKV